MPVSFGHASNGPDFQVDTDSDSSRNVNSESTFKDQINPKRQTAAPPEGGSPELDLASGVTPCAMPVFFHVTSVCHGCA
jgi:hypothetical protein